jgi:hypothetical protein
LSSASTCHLAHEKINNVRANQTAPPVTNARFAMRVCSGGLFPSQIEIDPEKADLQFFARAQLTHKLSRMRGDIGANIVVQHFVAQAA